MAQVLLDQVVNSDSYLGSYLCRYPGRQAGTYLRSKLPYLTYMYVVRQLPGQLLTYLVEAILEGGEDCRDNA
jgi:hypothetical protein